MHNAVQNAEPGQLRPPRILFYAVNGLGLGHLTRLMAIARKLREQQSVQPIFLSSSEASQLLYQEGFAHFKVPSKNSASSSGMKKSELQQIYQFLLQSVYAVFKPSVMVVDTFPVGLLNELFGILQLHNGIPKVLVQREVKEEKKNDLRIRQQGFYQHVIIPHHDKDTSVALRENVEHSYVGPILIRDKSEVFNREKALSVLGYQELAYQDKDQMIKTVYVNLGGGGDSEFSAGLRKIDQIAMQFPHLHFFIPRAPLARRLPEFHSSNLHLFSYYPVIEILSAFDLAISALGYNSFHELIYTETPTIFFAQERGFDDQADRGRKGVEKKLCRFIQNFNEKSIISELNAMQQMHIYREIKESLGKEAMANGARKAASIINSFLI